MDQEFVRRVRNDPSVRVWSKDPSEISAAKHSVWYDKILTNGREHLFVICHVGNAVPTVTEIGTLRVTIEGTNDSVGVVSLALLPGVRRMGYGTQALAFAFGLAAAWKLERLKADIHQDNVASLRLFTKMGFTPRGAVGAFVHFERPIGVTMKERRERSA